MIPWLGFILCAMRNEFSGGLVFICYLSPKTTARFFVMNEMVILHDLPPSSPLRIWSLHGFAPRHVTLPHEPLLVGSEGADDAMEDASVVEQHKVALAPVVGVDEARGNGGPLQAMHDAAHLGQVVDDRAGAEMDLADSGRVDLECELARDRVLPAHGKDLDLGRVDWGKVGVGQFEVVRVEAQTVGERASVGHPDVGVSGVFDFAGADKLFVDVGEHVVHVFARHEGSRSQRHVQLIASAVVVAQRLPPPVRYANRHQGRH